MKVVNEISRSNLLLGFTTESYSNIFKERMDCGKIVFIAFNLFWKLLQAIRFMYARLLIVLRKQQLQKYFQFLSIANDFMSWFDV